MPFANYKVPEGTLNAKQKEEIYPQDDRSVRLLLR